ncbi:hypothetical protein L4D77_18315 [Photobacterium frigidiphilum]|uniref:hypothetical protein n=1 Tax=Photobacterium frigidiphilum TaxID=264736 RepID=UPI003D0A578E
MEENQGNTNINELDTPKEVTDLDNFLQNGEQQQNFQLSTSMKYGREADPERAGRVFRQQLKTGLPSELIERNLDDIEKQSAEKDFDPVAFRNKSPLLSGWLQKPENAKVSHDDLENLSTMEWLFRAPVEAYQDGADQVRLGGLRYKQMTSQLNDNELQFIDAYKKRGPRSYGADSWIGEAFVGATGQLSQFTPMIEEGLKYGVPAGLTAGTFALAAGQAGPQIALPEEIFTVPGATALGLSSGFAYGKAKQSFELQTGLAYDEFKDFKDINGQPLDDDVAKGAAFFAGAFNAGLDFVALDKLIETIPGAKNIMSGGATAVIKQALKNPTVAEGLKRFSTEYGKSVSAQVMIDAGQELVQMIAGETAKRYQGNFENSDMAAIGDRMVEALDASLKANVVLSAPGHSMTLTGDLLKSRQAQQNKQIMQQLGNSTQQSKLHARAPEKVRELMATVKENGPVQDVMIPVEQWNTLFQSESVDPLSMAAEILGDDGMQYREAAATGSDIMIPLDVYTEKLAGSQYHNMLLDDMRFEPDQMTAREAAAWDASNQQNIEQQAASIADFITQPDETQFIFDDIVGQLKNTGMEMGTAETNAIQMQSFFRTLSSRTGINAKKLWSQYGPKITREMPEVLKSAGGNFDIAVDPILDRIRANDIPELSDIQGKTMLETLREKGIQDVGGELSARDVDVKLKPFQKKLISESGVTLDDAAQLMAEAGYIPADIDSVTQNDLLEAIDREMAGDPVYSQLNENAKALEDRETLLSMSGYLEDLGIDVSQVSNQDIKQQLSNQIANEGDGVTLNQAERGEIKISQDKKFQITFFKNADLSTLLHESGHMYFEILQDIDKKGMASESISNDLKTVRDWVGAKDGKDITTEQHEQFARGFEQYLREGKAPTTELQSAFARFRAWLVTIYRQASKLNVEVSDDVRQVFDRMLATDDQIKAAETQMEYNRLFEDAESAGMTEAEFNRYQKDATLAREQAQEEVTVKAFNEMQREQKKWWKDAEIDMRDQVMDEMAENPTYQAINYLQKGKLLDMDLPEGFEALKLSKDALIEKYGKQFLKLLPRPYIYTKTGGAHPDQIAMLFGFSSGDEMMQSIVNARPMKDVVNAEVDTRMRQQYGDMMNDGTLSETAMDATHNDRRASVLAAELKALSRRISSRGAPTPAAMMKQAAQTVVDRKIVRSLKPSVYLNAERKAAKQALEAVLAGDYAAAADAKQRQLLNFYMGNYTKKAKAETDKSRDYLNSFNRPQKRQALGKAGHDYLDQIDALLEKTEFKRVSLISLDRRKSLSEFIQNQEEQGWTVEIPESLVKQTQSRNWKDMTVEELTGLRDAVKNIDYLARFKNKLLRQDEKRKFEEIVDAAVSSIEANNVVHEIKPNFAETWKDRVKENVSGFMASHTKMEFFFEWLDGDSANGEAWRSFYKPINDADNKEKLMQESYTKRLAGILDAYTSKERGKWYTDTSHIQHVGRVNKAMAMSVALNWGNVGNQQAVLDGYTRNDGKNWTETEAQRILEMLDQKDWDTVQKVWDLINDLWPEISKLQKDLTGVSPEKVEASLIQTKYGEIKGGYYPLVYDQKLSYAVFKRDEKAATQDLFESNFSKPATKKGHTIERTGSGGQAVKLDLSVISEHIDNVIHDITHRRALMDTDRLIQNPRVRAAIEKTAGRQMYRQLRPWLQSIAREQQPTFNYVETLIGKARTGATVVNMGLKVTTAIAQPLGVLNSVDELGVISMMKGIKDFYANSPVGMKKRLDFVTSRSAMMRNRQKTFDRDIKDAAKRLGKDKKFDKVRESFFYLTGLLDMGVSVPTWLAAYRKALDGNVDGITAGDENTAIDFADRTVRVTQSEGGAKDLAKIQRGGEVFRSFTMFYSYFSVLHNQLRKRGRQYVRGDTNTAQLAASMFFLWFAPAVLGELVAGRGPGDDEDWDKWALKEISSYPFQTVVFVRDLVNGLGDFGYSASPAFDAFEMSVKAVKLPYKAIAPDEEVKRSDVKAAVLAAGYWGQLPSRQAWITGEYVYDMMTGEEKPEDGFEMMRNLMLTRPRD